MQLQTQEQVIHDKVNLGRLVNGLEKTIASEEFQRATKAPGKRPWLEVQANLHVSVSSIPGKTEANSVFVESEICP